MVAVTAKPAAATVVVTGVSAINGSAVRTIVDTKAKYEKRIQTVNSLSKHLSEADWEVLKDFLLHADETDRTQAAQVLKNRLLDVLCMQNPPPDGLGDLLAQIYNDHSQDGVIRDYAVQHLGAYYEQEAAQPDSADTLQTVQNVLWQATNEVGDSVAGTALLALERLALEYQTGFDQAKIAATALQMAGNSNAGELTRITAYQVCARTGATDALPLLVQTVQSGETMPERLSAIGALGFLGGTDQVPLLNSLLQGDEAPLKPAAQHALAQILARNH